jgi:hypothetical protein
MSTPPWQGEHSGQPPGTPPELGSQQRRGSVGMRWQHQPRQGNPTIGTHGVDHRARQSGPGGGDRRTWPWIAVGGALLAAGVAVTSVFVLNGSEKDDPRAVAEAYAAALSKADGSDRKLLCGKDRTALEAMDQVTKGLGELTKSLGLGSGPLTPESAAVTSVTANGDTGTATVEMRVSGSSRPVTETYDLVTEDGGWRICGVTRGLGLLGNLGGLGGGR